MKGKRKNENLLNTNQKSLSGFFGSEEKDENIVKKEKDENIVNEFIIKDDGTQINITKSNQIETDYYEKSRVETCVKRIKERFNVNIDILPVRYGTKPPINEKIYGYYMLVAIKSESNRERIKEFIRNECNLKVY